MDPQFSLLRTSDYTLFEKKFLLATGPDSFSIAPKTYTRFLPRTLAKIISWFRCPDMRVAKVRDAFSKCIERATTQSVGELTNLYIHAKNFNSRVIAKHNKTWIFWAKVPMLNMSSLEDKIRSELQNALSKLHRDADEKALKSAVAAIDGIVDPTLLPVELRLLHAKLETASEIYSNFHAEKINDDIDKLNKLETWTVKDIEKVKNEIMPLVEMFVQKDASFPSSKVNSHTATWQDIGNKLKRMLEDSTIQKKMGDAALQELTQMIKKVEELKKRLDEGLNMPALCAEISSLPLIPKQLEWLDSFLPKNKDIDSKIQLVNTHFGFIRKVSDLYPAHAEKLETHKREGLEELKSREGAYMNYGDIGRDGQYLRTTELMEYLRQAYPKAQHLVIKSFLDDVEELRFAQKICKNAKKLIALKMVPSDEEEAASKLKEVDAALDEVPEGPTDHIPKLYKKWKALGEEVAAVWAPVRQKVGK